MTCVPLPTTHGTPLGRRRFPSRTLTKGLTQRTRMMACARPVVAARVADAGPGPVSRRGSSSSRLRAVHVSAGVTSGSSTFAAKRFHSKRGNARGHPALAQAIAVNKATRSIDEMDMDPEHVTFASSDELDARYV